MWGGAVSGQSTTVYTDGACQGNPGPGGWAWAVPGGRYQSGADPYTTNQRMEIRAALVAVTSLDGRLEVVSDSTYVVNCFRDRWWESWLARGWINSAKKPVANRDLWEPMIAAYRADTERIRFRWVKGHGTDKMNDLVDRLAVAAAATQVGRSGVGRPEDLGPADVVRRTRTHGDGPSVGTVSGAGLSDDGRAVRGAGPGGGRAPVGTVSGAGPGDGGGGARSIDRQPPPRRDPLLPDGHLIMVTGLKPPGLGGYGDNPTAAAVRSRLAEILGAERQLHTDLVVLTGLGLGAEQLAAEAASGAGIPCVAVLPFPGVEQVWPDESRRRFAQLSAGAATTVTLQSKRPGSKQAAGAALARRDAWLAKHADEAIVVWDGEDPVLGRTVRSLQDRLGEEQVWILEPARYR